MYKKKSTITPTKKNTLLPSWIYAPAISRITDPEEEFQDSCTRCPRLGIWYSVQGKAYCDKCWAQYKHQCAYQKRQLAKGNCRCGRETQNADDLTCAKCQNASKATRAANHAAGLCWCGKVPVAGGKNCESCLISKGEIRKVRREKGLCECNRPLDDPRWKTCNACRERRERYRKPKKEVGE